MIIRHLEAETFRRVCMSFDAWIVSFGLSRVLIDLKLLASPTAYSVMLVTALVDAYLLYLYFGKAKSASLKEKNTGIYNPADH
jgi:hypothetical protein